MWVLPRRLDALLEDVVVVVELHPLNTRDVVHEAGLRKAHILPKVLDRRARGDLFEAFVPVVSVARVLICGRAVPKSPRVLQRMLDVVVLRVVKDGDELGALGRYRVLDIGHAFSSGAMKNGTGATLLIADGIEECAQFERDRVALVRLGNFVNLGHHVAHLVIALGCPNNFFPETPQVFPERVVFLLNLDVVVDLLLDIVMLH